MIASRLAMTVANTMEYLVAVLGVASGLVDDDPVHQTSTSLLAMTLRFKDRASEMIVETIDMLSASSTIFTMKERSIFSAFTGSLESYPSDE